MLVGGITFREHFALPLDTSRAASTNSVFLRLTLEKCSGTYRRVGLVTQPLYINERCDEWNEYVDNVFNWTANYSLYEYI